MEIKEPAIAYNKQKFTVDEYLQMERASEQKHGYYQGEMFFMSGAGKRHNVIFRNLFGELAYKLKGKSCRPFGSDLRIHIPENTLYTYTDISIICYRFSNNIKRDLSGRKAFLKLLNIPSCISTKSLLSPVASPRNTLLKARPFQNSKDCWDFKKAG